MMQESQVPRVDKAVVRWAIPILPTMLLGASIGWASEAQPANLVSDSAGSQDPLSISAAVPGNVRHIDISDPPPFVIMLSSTNAEQPTGTPVGECPKFLIRNGFESGILTQAAGVGTATQYVTRGGYLVKVDLHTITIQDPIALNKIEHWGDPHENLNGKHIKDWAGAAGWDGTRRTIVLGDGSKVFMISTGAQDVVLLTSIYDGEENVQIENATNTILHHSVDSADTQTRETTQHDGETSEFLTAETTGIANYRTIYNEDPAFQIVPFNVPLGNTGGCANPSMTNDLFDDPRLGRT